MNITEKILARASGKDKLEPDEVIFANVDKIMLHDVSGPGVIKTFEKLDKDRFRKELGNIIQAYQEVARRLGIIHEEANISEVKFGKPKAVNIKN